MFSRIGPAAFKKDLHNTLALCNSLGNPEQKFKCIHVAGTNGKGSTSHMIAAILQESGYKTGLYTSPHIKDFRERIRINGKMIEESFVVDFVQKTRELSESIQPSFFELTVAMAFDYFAANQVDVAVIETGLGGRLDSTNVVNPVLSVITNIGMDHMNMLGNTLQEIAAEKAGIIKKNTPVVIGETLPETMPVFEAKAREMNAPLYVAENYYQAKVSASTDNKLTFYVDDLMRGLTLKYTLGLSGHYQEKNLRTLLTVTDILNNNGFHLPEMAISHALENVKTITGLYGRWDVLRADPAVILDVGHNEDGIRQILQQLSLNYPENRLHFVLGFVNDKDIRKILSLFPAGARYYFTNAHIPRALPYGHLQVLASACSLNGTGFDDVNDAIKSALTVAGNNDAVMVCGSFFIISEVDTAFFTS